MQLNTYSIVQKASRIDHQNAHHQPISRANWTNALSHEATYTTHAIVSVVK